MAVGLRIRPSLQLETSRPVRHPVHKASALSLMPAALLNSLDKEQVLDLLAYILADGSADHAAFKHVH